MKISSIDVDAAIKEAEQQLKSIKGKSPEIIARKAAFKLLLTIIKLLMDRLSLDSRISSKPPSSDGFKKVAKQEKKSSTRSSGGQKGHVGTTLERTETPDYVEVIKANEASLPAGNYVEVGFEKRQVVEIKTRTFIIEYQAQVIKNEMGQRFVAPFPADLKRPIQYGASVKSHVVYLACWQLTPLNRILEHFAGLYNLPISEGSLCNFNREAYEKLATFEKVAKHVLSKASVAHADETGINVGGSNSWLHDLSNDRWTLFVPHRIRGSEAMDSIGVLTQFQGVLSHDHWKSYYRYTCLHALCNAHHLRELTRAHEQDGQVWAESMRVLLLEINQSVVKADGALPKAEQDKWRESYRSLLDKADKECPPPPKPKKKKRGRVPRSKSRNLLERLRDYESDVLRFMEQKDVPFTNNQAERDIRMTKVQQKISGCFRTFKGAQTFCRVRSYLSTCRKHGMDAAEGLTLLFNGTLPDFIQKEVDKNPQLIE